ncbi:protein ALP1-like [Ipomoea triloba]|uniref:protein ALP1-like n=1 Tax=Ipomoea triloba TaxID=35885 RepID=UPI00125D6753|nr:protein ALP1-like [Ipomoea triloba]
MNLQAFFKLCEMLVSLGGLQPTKNIDIDEQVAIFLHILAHHVKNRVIQNNFKRSGESISRTFHKVLNALMRSQGHLFRTPEPVPTNCSDNLWKWFKNCLGALDETFIKVNVPSCDKPRHRTRKGDIATNVLGVCTPDMQFVYVLSGWEGSVADSRVLRDAISRAHALKVPHGCYYLVDAGYTNCEGFLAPFRGQRYHLNEWRQGYQPTSSQEFFNMKHATARNVIERCFGLLKMRWGI